MRLRSVVFAALGAGLLVSAASPAFAQRFHGGFGFHGGPGFRGYYAGGYRGYYGWYRHPYWWGPRVVVGAPYPYPYYPYGYPAPVVTFGIR
jgi:hypothetical protein